MCTFKCNAREITTIAPGGGGEPSVRVEIASPSEIIGRLPPKAWKKLTEGEKIAWLEVLGKFMEADHGISAHMATVEKWFGLVERYSLGSGGA